jgi:chemotaxis protein methyltransferase WspC
MSLIEAGVPTHRCYVEGVDISHQALESAHAALYGPNSFRGSRSLMHKRLFDREDSLLRVQPQVRKCVRFIHDNVVSPTFKLANKHYDVVFCRNLLIYLTPEAQTRVFTLCRAMIGSEGLVCFGPAETEMARLAGFVPTGPGGSCFFRAKSKQTSSPTAMKQLQTHKVKRDRLVPSGSALLQRAYAEANQGNVSVAMDLCRTYLTQDSSSVDANFLMGTLHQSSRNEDLASEFFKRVVYLDPKHYEALVHLALLAEKSGYSLTAERFWERAKKSHGGSEGNDVGDELFNLPLTFLSEGDNK